MEKIFITIRKCGVPHYVKIAIFIQKLKFFATQTQYCYGAFQKKSVLDFLLQTDIIEIFQKSYRT